MATSISLQDRRLWRVGGAVVAVLIVAAAWFLAIHPKLSAASSLRDQANAADLNDSVLQAKAAALQKQSQQLPSLQALLRAALTALTDELNAAATQAGVTLTGISANAPTAITDAGAAAQAAAGASSSLYSIPLSLTTTGSLSQQAAFLQAVQSGARRALVTATTLSQASGVTKGAGAGTVSVTTQLNVFSQPQTAQQAAQLQHLLAATPSG